MSTRALNPRKNPPSNLIIGSLVLSVLMLAIFAISLIPTTPAAEPVLAAQPSETDILMSGAISARIDTRDVTLTCTETGVLMEVGFNGGYATLISLGTASKQVGLHSFGNSASTLELSLLDETGNAYRTFSATEGSLELTSNGGRFSAVLWSEASEQLFLSTRWRC